MAEIHNLRLFRKTKMRASSEKQAAENRSRFGRSKAERESAEAKSALEGRRLDAHLRQKPDEPEGKSD
jgi:hypothetical protein